MDKFVPESVLVKLVVGQRVRYMGSNEPCNYMPTVGSYSSDYGTTGHESFIDAESKVGTIIYLDAEFPGHPYEVEMDERYKFGDRTWLHVTAAAHELALVEDE